MHSALLCLPIISHKRACGLILPEPPSTLFPVSSILTSALILGSDTAKVIFQDQRSMSEMRFRLLASLSDGISFHITRYRRWAPLPLYLRIASTLYSSSPSTTTGEGGLSSLSNSLDLWNLFRFDTWKTRWIRQAWGRSNLHATGEITLVTQ